MTVPLDPTYSLTTGSPDHPIRVDDLRITDRTDRATPGGDSLWTKPDEASWGGADMAAAGASARVIAITHFAGSKYRILRGDKERAVALAEVGMQYANAAFTMGC